MPKAKTQHPFFSKEERPGTLIIVEGQDGSGKSTQARIIQRLLESNGFYCHFSEWNSSEKVRLVTKEVKKKDPHCPAAVFDMMFASDFIERYISDIKGCLSAGMVVICDRYTYTALARGAARGIAIKDLRNFYDRFFPVPDMALYFRLPVEVGMQRAIGRNELKHYEAGMDVKYSDNILESFKSFQTNIMNAYDELAESDGMYVIDATKPVYETTPEATKLVAEYMHKKYGVKLMGIHTT